MLLSTEQLDLDSVSAILFRLAGVIFEDMVHLFESATFCLRNEEECPRECE